jgi:hypothetical protein
VNEQIEQVSGIFERDAHIPFLCDCGNTECTQTIELSRREYERVRAHASRFIVVLNHENPEAESVIEQNSRFAIVETYAGGASRVAREWDPRSQQTMRRQAEEQERPPRREVPR